jgi:hypothetical protein
MMLLWKTLYTLLRTYSRSDVLVCLFYCHVVAAMNDVSLDLRKDALSTELLMACSADRYAGGPGKTFTDAYTVTLKKMSMRHNPFSVAGLSREMTAQVQRWKSHLPFSVKWKSY